MSTIDFFAANKKLLGKIMEGTVKAKPHIKPVMLRQYLEATGAESGSIPQGHVERIREKDSQVQSGHSPPAQRKRTTDKVPLLQKNRLLSQTSDV